jgi:hypothetical protein
MKTKSLMLGAGSVLSVLVLSPLAASAATYTTDSITSPVTGAGQVGIQVTANFSTGAPETLTWVNDGGLGKVLSLDRWGLSVSGDTFSNDWNLFVDASLNLTSLVINGVPGNVVFDLTTSPGDGTSGSGPGLTFTTAFSGVTGTYSNPVALSSDPTNPVGDLYTTLTLTFPTGFSGEDFFYRADTDKADTPLITGTTPPPTGTPEPSAVLGLLALGLVGRRLGSKAR